MRAEKTGGIADALAGVGRALFDLAAFTGGLLGFTGRVLGTLRRGVPSAELLAQVLEIGARSLPLTAISAFAIGLVLALQSLTLLQKFGVVQYAAVGVGLGVTRELGPVVTALMVAGRAGSGITAEIGSMKVTRQIDALRLLAVDPHRFLAATRIVACVITLPLLTAISDVLGIIGGALITTALGGVPLGAYVDTTLYYVTLGDVMTGLGKSVLFALLIGAIASWNGFRTEGGTTGVGQATTRTVVQASLMIFVSDVFVTQMLVSVGW